MPESRIDPNLQTMITGYVDRERNRLIDLTRDLIRIPSENTAPAGAERACQECILDVLQKSGWDAELYELSEVKGLNEHPLFWPGRNYANRPNLGARRRGSGGRSLVLSGHIDTVPRGTQHWTRDPFGAEVEGNHIYGRGANDMKAGVAMNVFVAEAIASLKIRLGGDLIFESVIDEEFGGVNGTLAGRLRGYNGDAAVISEPSSLRICPAQRGGRVAHLIFRDPAKVTEQLTHFLNQVPEFAAQRRRNARIHELYRNHADPVPVLITKIFTSPWGTTEPITVPDICKVEFYWQLMPGETQDQVESEFFSWFDHVIRLRPDIFPTSPGIEFPMRWMPGSAIASSEPLVRELAACAETVLGVRPPIAGIEGPCDMFVFQQQFSIPTVLWGSHGGNIHAADEYVEVDSLVDAAKTLLLFVCRWCGVN